MKEMIQDDDADSPCPTGIYILLANGRRVPLAERYPGQLGKGIEQVLASIRDVMKDGERVFGSKAVNVIFEAA